jgi:hypothetical protein
MTPPKIAITIGAKAEKQFSSDSAYDSKSAGMPTRLKLQMGQTARGAKRRAAQVLDEAGHPMHLLDGSDFLLPRVIGKTT